MGATAGRTAAVALLVLALVLSAAWALSRVPVIGSPPGNSAPIDDNHPPGWKHSHGSGDRTTTSPQDGTSRSVATEEEDLER